jgi:transcriptional regulator with XRE-family HTH domain
MKQPELGIRISETRNLRGITQKELSDLCNVDIRTIQRIESGEVVPRMSTLRLICETLDIPLIPADESLQGPQDLFLKRAILLSLAAVLINLINWGFYTPVFPKNALLASLELVYIVVNLLSGILYNYGFYEIGRFRNNRILRISSLVFILLIPLFVISRLQYPQLHILLMILSGLNGIFFGAALITTRSRHSLVWRIGGILQILICPFFMIPLPLLNIIGCWIELPFLFCLALILYFEYRGLSVRVQANVAEPAN